MKNIRRGIGVLALACAIGTVGACSGNGRTQPDWGPRVSRGSSGGSGGSARTRVKRNGDTPNGNNGQRRGQKKSGKAGNGNGNGNGNDGKKRGNP